MVDEFVFGKEVIVVDVELELIDVVLFRLEEDVVIVVGIEFVVDKEASVELAILVLFRLVDSVVKTVEFNDETDETVEVDCIGVVDVVVKFDSIVDWFVWTNDVVKLEKDMLLPIVELLGDIDVDDPIVDVWNFEVESVVVELEGVDDTTEIGVLIEIYDSVEVENKELLLVPSDDDCVVVEFEEVNVDAFVEFKLKGGMVDKVVFNEREWVVEELLLFSLFVEIDDSSPISVVEAFDVVKMVKSIDVFDEANNVVDIVLFSIEVGACWFKTPLPNAGFVKIIVDGFEGTFDAEEDSEEALEILADVLATKGAEINVASEGNDDSDDDVWEFRLVDEVEFEVIPVLIVDELKLGTEDEFKLFSNESTWVVLFKDRVIWDIILFVCVFIILVVESVELDDGGEIVKVEYFFDSPLSVEVSHLVSCNKTTIRKRTRKNLFRSKTIRLFNIIFWFRFYCCCFFLSLFLDDFVKKI